jgi:2-keto-3-deoxy-L-fuconate dehydrogenase
VNSEFDGSVAVVTGGGSGIGQATCRELAARGARVASWDVAPGHGAEGILDIEVDVTDDEAVADAVRTTVERLGGIDVLVSNAGVGARGTVEDTDDDDWQLVLDVNVLGTVRVCRAVLPALRRSQRPAIVLTGSVAAWTGIRQRAAYSASKGALHALMLAMAADHVDEGIRVNCIHPGTADTPWVQRLLDAADDPAAERAQLEARQPLGRLVSADEVAHAICYLASPRSGSTTGTALGVDGGSYGLLLVR